MPQAAKRSVSEAATAGWQLRSGRSGVMCNSAMYSVALMHWGRMVADASGCGGGSGNTHETTGRSSTARPLQLPEAGPGWLRSSCSPEGLPMDLDALYWVVSPS